MTVLLSSQTQKLLDQQMETGHFASADDALRVALETLDQLRGEDIEELDEQTQAALAGAFAQSDCGEGRPWSEVREELASKYLAK